MGSSGDGLGAETREAPPRTAGPLKERAWALTILFHPARGRAGERALLGSTGSFELSRLSPELSLAGPARPLADAFISRSPVRLHIDLLLRIPGDLLLEIERERLK